MNKFPIVISGALAVGLLIFTIIVNTKPVETSSKVVLASYEHRGEFNYTGYTVEPANNNAPLILYPKIIENMDIFFTSSGTSSGEVDISATFEDQSTGWRKEIPIEVSGGPIYSFPLDIKQILELGNTINTELGGRSNSYLLKITSTVGNGENAKTTTLEGTLSASALVWNEEGFYTVERGYPGSDNLVSTAFGYRAQLTDNSLFGPIAIERQPNLPAIQTIDAGTLPTTDQVKFVKIDFAHRLLSNAKTQSIRSVLNMELTMSEADGWSKTYPLPPVEKDGAIDQEIYLNIGKLLAMADANDVEAGGRAAQDRQITVNAKVHAIARTDNGVIDEVFQQQLTGKMGKVFTWSTSDKTGKDLLVSTKPGQLTTTITRFNRTLSTLRLITVIILALCIGAFVFLLIYYWRRNPRQSSLRSFKANSKKYKDLISEVDSFPQNGTLEKIAEVPSLDSLAKISNNALKPILLKEGPDGYYYRVIDGQSTYQFVARTERPVSRSNSQDK